MDCNLPASLGTPTGTSWPKRLVVLGYLYDYSNFVNTKMIGLVTYIIFSVLLTLFHVAVSQIC